MTNAPKTVLAIHDLPGLGRAALSVIVPVLSALGVQAVALPTAVLSTHTGGLGAPARLADPALRRWPITIGSGSSSTASTQVIWLMPRRQSWCSRPLRCGPAPSRSWTLCWGTAAGCTAVWGRIWSPPCTTCAATLI